ncbi:MAG TPA: maleylpyruvate isomerase family mycothiol-dependent enzyme [Kineosporiaceae bacterium]|nr:maleylpyruvate isomerase family mycothiol-dependent enzyme [Kineosporiaceae bacterium]
MATPTDVAADLDRLAAATERLMATVAGWDATDLAAPSILPGWSRSHVLTHLARNADGMRNCLLAARTGVKVPMYPSREVRDADIVAGATRPASVVLEDLRASAERFAVDAADLGEQAWSREVTFGAFTTAASGVIPHRLREVEAHHVDLGAGYTFADAPDDALLTFLDVLPAKFTGSHLDPCTVVATDLDREWRIGTGRGPRVAGAAAALLPWLMGRSGPAGVTSDDGAVPESPGWG